LVIGVGRGGAGGLGGALEDVHGFSLSHFQFKGIGHGVGISSGGMACFPPRDLRIVCAIARHAAKLVDGPAFAPIILRRDKKATY